MNVAFFDYKKYEKGFYKSHDDIRFHFFESRLSSKTVNLCQGMDAVCVFVNDQLDQSCLNSLSKFGVKLVVLRCAGFNNVDIDRAAALSIKVCRVPSYSPESVAEFTLTQLLSLKRKIHRAYQRTIDFNFSLEGLVGEKVSNKTIGVIGLGKIGLCFVKLLQGFDCRILVYDKENPTSQDLQYELTSLDQLLKESDVISLHVPLNEETHHILDHKSFEKMKTGVCIINTGRGGLIDTRALIDNLKSKKIGAAALDVYEEEENYFFSDHSSQGIDDDLLARLTTFPNVLVTSHQGYLTDDALKEIAGATMVTLNQWQNKEILSNEIKYEAL